MADRDRRSKTLFAAHIARMQTSTPAPPTNPSSNTAPSASTQPATGTSFIQLQASNASTRAPPTNSSSGTSRPPRASKVVGSNPMLGHPGLGPKAPSGGGLFGTRPSRPLGTLFGPRSPTTSQDPDDDGLFGAQPASDATAPKFVYQPLSLAAAIGIFGGPITQIIQPYSAPLADPINAGPSISHSPGAGQSTLQSSQPPVFGASGNARPVHRSPPGNFGNVAAPRIFVTDNTMPSTKDYGTPSPSTLFFTLSQLPRYIGPDCHWDFQSMTAVTRYAPWSPEELRLADYTKGITGPPKNLGEHLNLQSVSTDPTNPGPPVPPKRASYSYGRVSLSSTDNKPATTDSMQTDPKE